MHNSQGTMVEKKLPDNEEKCKGQAFTMVIILRMVDEKNILIVEGKILIRILNQIMQVKLDGVTSIKWCSHLK